MQTVPTTIPARRPAHRPSRRTQLKAIQQRRSINRNLNRPLPSTGLERLLRVRSVYCADDDSEGRSNHDTDPDPDRILGEGEHHYAEDDAEAGPEADLVEESRSVVAPFVPASR